MTVENANGSLPRPPQRRRKPPAPQPPTNGSSETTGERQSPLPVESKTLPRPSLRETVKLRNSNLSDSSSSNETVNSDESQSQRPKSTLVTGSLDRKKLGRTNSDGRKSLLIPRSKVERPQVPPPPVPRGARNSLPTATTTSTSTTTTTERVYPVVPPRPAVRAIDLRKQKSLEDLLSGSSSSHNEKLYPDLDSVQQSALTSLDNQSQSMDTKPRVSLDNSDIPTVADDSVSGELCDNEKENDAQVVEVNGKASADLPASASPPPEDNEPGGHESVHGDDNRTNNEVTF